MIFIYITSLVTPSSLLLLLSGISLVVINVSSSLETFFSRGCRSLLSYPPSSLTFSLSFFFFYVRHSYLHNWPLVLFVIREGREICVFTEKPEIGSSASANTKHKHFCNHTICKWSPVNKRILSVCVSRVPTQVFLILYVNFWRLKPAHFFLDLYLISSYFFGSFLFRSDTGQSHVVLHIFLLPQTT